MKTPIIVGLVMMALLLGGCVVGNQLLPEGTLAPTEDPAGEVRVRIESRPSGALIVMGGQVVGHAPLEVLLPVSRLGFFPESTTVRARFRAEDERYGGAQTVSARFTVQQKVPAVVFFTPAGFTWVAR